MKNRYLYTKIDKDDHGKRKYETTMYPKIERTLDDIYIISRLGDRLDLYSFKYYGNTQDWYIIAHANQLGLGSLSVPPGLQIRIPMNLADFEVKLEKNNK